eukprot:c12789_g1_i2.p1 GENE.c12789_g1_i2~~c12789_g1_i2.p1  ORF type:complete len:505 (-),score=79.95 c12789_g1_i2:1184-2698(-)
MARHEEQAQTQALFVSDKETLLPQSLLPPVSQHLVVIPFRQSNIHHDVACGFLELALNPLALTISFFATNNQHSKFHFCPLVIDVHHICRVHLTLEGFNSPSTPSHPDFMPHLLLGLELRSRHLPSKFSNHHTQHHLSCSESRHHQFSKYDDHTIIPADSNIPQLLCFHISPEHTHTACKLLQCVRQATNSPFAGLPSWTFQIPCGLYSRHIRRAVEIITAISILVSTMFSLWQLYHNSQAVHEFFEPITDAIAPYISNAFIIADRILVDLNELFLRIGRPLLTLLTSLWSVVLSQALSQPLALLFQSAFFLLLGKFFSLASVFWQATSLFQNQVFVGLNTIFDSFATGIGICFKFCLWTIQIVTFMLSPFVRFCSLLQQFIAPRLLLHITFFTSNTCALVHILLSPFLVLLKLIQSLTNSVLFSSLLGIYRFVLSVSWSCTDMLVCVMLGVWRALPRTIHFTPKYAVNKFVVDNFIKLARGTRELTMRFSSIHTFIKKEHEKV